LTRCLCLLCSNVAKQQDRQVESDRDAEGRPGSVAVVVVRQGNAVALSGPSGPGCGIRSPGHFFSWGLRGCVEGLCPGRTCSRGSR
jgi:hypothetical protein